MVTADQPEPTERERNTTVDMTAAEYRAKAVELLRQAARRGLPTHDRDRAERQAAVWASLAQSAATSETKEN